MDSLHEHIFSRPKGIGLTASEIETQCYDIEQLAKSQTAAQAMLPQALAMVRAAPKDFRPQLLAATLMERARVKSNMLDTWTALHDRHPHVKVALRYMVRWLNRDGQTDEATQLLFALVENDSDLYGTTELAELCSEIKDQGQAKGLFQKLLENDPENISLRVIYGKSLLAMGDIYAAFEVLGPIETKRLSATASHVVRKGQKAHAAMTALGAGEASVLTRTIESFASRKPRHVPSYRIEGISFYTGSLGAGGAERQLTQMASAFHHRARAGRNIHGTRISGQVEVIVNNLDSARGKDFFAPALKASGVPLSVAEAMPVTPLTDLKISNSDLAALLPHLPRNVRFGLERLTQHFIKKAPDVAFFWQDGAVLTGALAALIANVPKISISLRGMPPNLRPNMMKPEYPDLFQALSKVPGVSFSCNSRAAANAYADWLKLPRDRFSVIYNAVQPLPMEANITDQRRWEVFEQETQDATFTLGGIFRFNPNKRGLLWLDYAQHLTKSNPKSRFILVGDGEELALAQSAAKDFGLEGKILFAGSSKCPGFWLSKMDAVCLLSENEGLPNVLIEAQLASKPVISTPAGGASEAFQDAESGFLLSSASNPSLEEFQIYVDALVDDEKMRERMGEAGFEHAARKFDRETVFAQTIRFFLGETVAADQEYSTNLKVTQLTPKSERLGLSPEVSAAYNLGTKF